MTHRVEWETGYVVFEGDYAACCRFIGSHRYAEELILVSAVTGRAVSWIQQVEAA